MSPFYSNYDWCDNWKDWRCKYNISPWLKILKKKNEIKQPPKRLYRIIQKEKKKHKYYQWNVSRILSWIWLPDSQLATLKFEKTKWEKKQHTHNTTTWNWPGTELNWGLKRKMHNVCVITGIWTKSTHWQGEILTTSYKQAFSILYLCTHKVKF